MNKDFDGYAESSRQIGNPSLGQVNLLRTLAPQKKASWRGPWIFVIVQGLVRRKSRLVSRELRVWAGNQSCGESLKQRNGALSGYLAGIESASIVGDFRGRLRPVDFGEGMASLLKHSLRQRPGTCSHSFSL